MTQSSTDDLARRYDRAAPLWADKMRALGYYDGYLGFLSHNRAALPVAGTRPRVIDIGAGSAAMAEAFVAVWGHDLQLTLLDPSAAMLSRGAQALGRRGVVPRLMATGLTAQSAGPHDVVLAAHVIEHFDDPLAALRLLRACIAPGGRLWLVVSKPHWYNALIWLRWRHRTFTDADIVGMADAADLRVDARYAFPAGPPARTSRGYLLTAT